MSDGVDVLQRLPGALVNAVYSSRPRPGVMQVVENAVPWTSGIMLEKPAANQKSQGKQNTW